MVGARAPRLRLSEPLVPEHDIQRTVVRVLRLELGPPGGVSEAGVCWFSIDMSNSHDAVPGIRTGRGVIAGVPDMIILHAGRAYWIELKARDGVVSDPQRSLAATLLLSGCRIGIARNEGEVLALLDVWEVPRKRRVRIAA